MKIKYHKPVSIYTHPSITDYEFGRMQKVERLYVSLCAVTFTVMFVIVPFIVFTRAAKEEIHIPKAPAAIVQPVISQPALTHFSNDNITISSAADLEVNVGATTVDTR